MSNRTSGLGAAALLAAGFALTFGVMPWDDERVTDLPLYTSYAHLFLDGVLPFRDVGFEYPPLAAPVLAAAGLVGGGEAGYRIAFAAGAFACALALVFLCGAIAERTGGDRDRARFAAAAAPLLCGAMLRTHFDVVPVVLTAAALLLLCVDRPRLGMAVLGVGVAVKLYPLVIAPVALAWLAGRGDRRAAIDGALALVLVAGAVYGAALGLSASGTVDSLRYHAERAVQVESSPALVLVGLDSLGLGTATHDGGHRSDGLDHPASGAITGAFAALMVLAIAALARGAWLVGGRCALVLASLAATIAFACLGKVLSPQYLIWIVPLAALAVAWGERALAALCVAALLLTLLEFPAHYREVVDRVPWVLAVVALRDLALIGVVAAALRSVRREREPGAAGSRWHGHPRPPRPAPR